MVLAKRSIVDIPTAMLAAVALLLLWKFRKVQEPLIVAGAAIVGLVVYPLMRA